MFGVLGTSDVGTADADAAPTSEKVNPAAPNAGTAFPTRFRFESCFTPGIVAPPYLQKNVSSPAREILRFANAPCKVGWYADVPCVLDFMFMNDMFMSDFGAVYPIIISVIQRVPDHRNARQVRSDRGLKARLDTLPSNNL
jgi:hypothetical protein